MPNKKPVYIAWEKDNQLWRVKPPGFTIKGRTGWKYLNQAFEQADRIIAQYPGLEGVLIEGVDS